jgi:hypothetical protein
MPFRQDRMTSTERLNALFRREPVDRVPFSPIATGFNAVNTGFSIADYYRETGRGSRTSFSAPSAQLHSEEPSGGLSASSTRPRR